MRQKTASSPCPLIGWSVSSSLTVMIASRDRLSPEISMSISIMTSPAWYARSSLGRTLKSIDPWEPWPLPNVEDSTCKDPRSFVKSPARNCWIWIRSLTFQHRHLMEQDRQNIDQRRVRDEDTPERLCGYEAVQVQQNEFNVVQITNNEVSLIQMSYQGTRVGGETKPYK